MSDISRFESYLNQLKVNRFKEVEQKSSFATLPYEILSSILVLLNTQELAAVLCVCRSWRRRVLTCQEAFLTLTLYETQVDHSISRGGRALFEDTDLVAWADMDIYREVSTLIGWCKSDAALELSRQLITAPTIREYVQEMYLHMASRQHYQNLVYQISKYNFPHLRKLHITEFSIEGKEPLIPALRNVAGTLSDLFIATNRRVLVPFGSILSTCHNLTSFNYVHSGRIEKVDVTNVPEYPIALEHLYLTFKCNKAFKATQVIERTLVKCPRLRTFYIQTIDITMKHLFPLVVQNCENLERLRFFHDFDYHRSLSSINGAVQLDELRIYRTGWSQALIPFLHLSTETLQSLHLELGPMMRNRDELLTMTFSNLIRLHLCFDSSTSDEENLFVARLLGCMPNLEEIELKMFRHQLSLVFDKIANLRHLRKLSITESKSLNGDALSKALFQFSKRRCLTAVTIGVFSVDGSGDNILDSLAVVDSLKEVRFWQCPFISEETLNRFCENLQHHPSIALLGFDMFNAVTDRTLEILANVGALKKLELGHGIKNISRDAIDSFREKNNVVALEAHRYP